MNFRKNSKRFQKIMLQSFYNGYGRIYARRYKGQIVWNACTRDGNHSEGWRVGVNSRLKPFQKFILFGTLRLVWLEEPSTKWVLFWFFSIQLLKKHTLNPDITNCMLKKPCLKFPKSAHIFFGLKMTPPLWNFSENSSDLVQPSFPYGFNSFNFLPLCSGIAS